MNSSAERVTQKYLLRHWFGATLLIWLFAAMPVLAQDNAVDWKREGQNINSNADWLIDASNKLTINDVLLPANQARFQPTHGQSAVGVTSAAYWVRVRIDTPKLNEGSWWLLVSPPYQDDLRVYFPSGESTYRERRSGALVPYSAGRDLDFGLPSFRLANDHVQSKIVYLRVHAFTGTTFQLSLWREDGLRHHLQGTTMFVSMLYGLILGLMIYNLLLFASLRNAIYGIFVLYLCTLFLAIAHLNGDNFRYLWPEASRIETHANIFVFCLWSASSAIFAIIFFSLKDNNPWVTKSIIGFALLQAVIICLDLARLRSLAAMLLYGFGFCWTLSFLMIAIYYLRQGFTPARYILGGLVVTLIGVIELLLRTNGFIQPSAMTEHLNEAGAALQALMYSLALAARISLLQKEREVALLDPLTGLITRRLFADRFEKASQLAERQKYNLVLLLIDLDRFKPINDQHGHDAGDAVLKEIANRLLGAVRANDSVARFGGDEFAILMVGPIEMGELMAGAQRIIATVEQPVAHKNLMLQVSLSIGIAVWPEHGEDFASLYKSADLALYQAKREGRACFKVAGTPDSQAQAVASLA